MCCSVLQCVAVCCSVRIFRVMCMCVCIFVCVCMCAYLRGYCWVLDIVSQCVKVCHSVSQCVAVRRSASQCVAVSCSASQCIAACRTVLPCVAVRHTKPSARTQRGNHSGLIMFNNIDDTTLQQKHFLPYLAANHDIVACHEGFGSQHLRHTAQAPCVREYVSQRERERERVFAKYVLVTLRKGIRRDLPNQ